MGVSLGPSLRDLKVVGRLRSPTLKRWAIVVHPSGTTNPSGIARPGRSSVQRFVGLEYFGTGLLIDISVLDCFAGRLLSLTWCAGKSEIRAFVADNLSHRVG